MEKLKCERKGNIDHHPEINETSRNKLHVYTSVYLNPNTESGLFNKVQLDIQMYVCHRANKNIHSMIKATFNIATDATSRLCVVGQIDILTKNHHEKD
jgi:hypothetical protein